jgi:hypothetical protein
MSKPSTDELEQWLEWAGTRLIAMPGPRVGPSESTGWWPDYSQDRYEVIEFRARIALRIAAPSGSEIELMEEILYLPSLIGVGVNEHDCEVRRVVRRRILLHPITNRRLWQWDRLAKEHKRSQVTLRTWYKKGLSQICRRISGDKTTSIRKQFELNVMAS